MITSEMFNEFRNVGESINVVSQLLLPVFGRKENETILSKSDLQTGKKLLIHCAGPVTK